LLSGAVSSATDSTISWNGEKVLEMLRKTKLSYTPVRPQEFLLHFSWIGSLPPSDVL
jgi:hypothetical protein